MTSVRYLGQEQRTRYALRSIIGDLQHEWRTHCNYGVWPGGTALEFHQPDYEVSSGTSFIARPRVALVESFPEKAVTATWNADSELEARRSVEKSFRALLRSPNEEQYKDGFESNLSVGVATLIKRYAAQAVSVLRELLRSERIPDLMSSEILLALGRIDDLKSLEARFGLVVSYLRHESPIVRDSAALALAHMDYRQAIPYLEQAIEAEKIPSLRRDMGAVLEQLRA